MDTTLQQLEDLAFSTPGQPTSEEQAQAFFMAWEGKLRTTVANMLKDFTPEDHDDAFQIVMMAWFKGDWISKFDESLGFARSTWIYDFFRRRLLAVMRHLLAKEKSVYKNHTVQRVYRRDDVSFEDMIDAVMAVDGVEEVDESEKLFDEIDAALGNLPNTRRDLQKFFRVIRQYQATHGVDPQNKELAELMGVGPASITNYKRHLQHVLVAKGFVDLAETGHAVWNIG